MTPETNHGNRRRFWRRLLLVLGVQVFGLFCIGAAIELRRATQSEVNSGSRVNAWVGPYELNHWTGAGSPTGGMTQAQAQSSYASGSNTFVGTHQGNGAGLTNVPLSGLSTNIIIATNQPFTAGQALVYVGTNSTGQPMFKSTNWPAGGGSPTPWVSDIDGGGFNLTNVNTISVSTFTAATTWQTNVVTPTNSFAGTVIDVSKTDNGITNLAGDFTFTGVSGITLGGVNSAYVDFFAGASARTIDVANASMHKETNWNTSLPAGWEMIVMAYVRPGIRTNFLQIIIP